MSAETASLPLSGITIIDLSQIYNGPYATFLLATSGADVIKVEPPGGEPLRRRGVVGGAALPFAMLNNCKRSIVLDLKSEEGKQALKDLVRDADVVVENYAPGTMDRLGIGKEVLTAINPDLIYASSTGFGTDGPYRTYPAMDLTVQAMSGVMSVTGFPDRPPVKAGPALCDFFAGVHLYGGIVTALYEREKTGHPRRVSVSMQDAVYASLSSSLGMEWGTAGQEDRPPPRTGNRHGGMAEAPYNVYPTSDGYIAIICVGDTQWRKLCQAMHRSDLAEDPALDTLGKRVAAMNLVDEIVGTWTGTLDKEEAFRVLMEHRVPCAPVRTLDEVMRDENMHARGSLQWQDHPELGRIVVQHSPLRFDGVTPCPLEPSHALGADTAALLAERLGWSNDMAEAAAGRKREDQPG